MLRNRKRQLVSCGVRKQKGNEANRKGGFGPRVWEGRRLTGPWERWRATGKGRTEGRGAEEGAAAVKPFSTMAPTRRKGGAAAAAAAGVGAAGWKGSSTTLRRVGWAPPGWCRRFAGASIVEGTGIGALRGAAISEEGLRGD